MRKKRTGRVAEADAAQMHADYLRLRSLKQAAALHGRTFQSLYAILKHRGLIAKTKERALPRATVAAMYSDYLQLRSVAKVAKKWGKTRQSIWDILRRRYKLRVMRRHEFRMHGGRKYTPQERGAGSRGGSYWRATVEPRDFLHYVIWREERGEIPPGHELTFADGDTRNCAIENLLCLPKAEMRRRNSPGVNQHTMARDAALVQGVEAWLYQQANWVARKYGGDVEEYAQIGRVKALKLARIWKKEGGCNFLSWIFRAVRTEMQRAAKKQANIVHVPDAKFFTAGVSQVSMDAPVGDEADGETYGNLFVSEDETVTAAAVTGERAAVLRKKLATLPARTREILRLRFFEDLTHQEIGERYGLSHQRICQIEAAAMAKLRRSRNLKRLEAA